MRVYPGVTVMPEPTAFEAAPEPLGPEDAQPVVAPTAQKAG